MQRLVHPTVRAATLALARHGERLARRVRPPTLPDLRGGLRAVEPEVRLQAWADRLGSKIAVGPWGWVPGLTLLSAAMLWLVVLGHALSRSGHGFGGIPFWVGLMVPIGAVAVRQGPPDVARPERIVLLVLAGLFLYLAKVARDPSGFTFADEFIQAYNTEQVLEHGSLFRTNPLLPATSDYPGLAAVTAAVASLTHLSSFGAGIVVIGAARLIMILALYLLFERAAASPRVAALGVLGYAAAPNFLYYTAEVSYESLALPVATTALYAVLAWSVSRSDPRRAWTVVALLLVATVVVTHHVTSYALVAVLLAFSLARSWTWRRRWTPKQLFSHDSPLPFALGAAVVTCAWLWLVAERTTAYLRPVFGNAIRDVTAVVRQEGHARTPFASLAGLAPPFWDRWAALAGTVIVVVAVAVGLLAVRKGRHREDAFVLVLAAAAVGYVATLPLRLVGSAWEIANRATEFLFIGVALVAALAAARILGAKPDLRVRIAVAALAAVIFAGGAALGWRYDTRLAGARYVAAGEEVIEPQGVAAARWSADELPTSPRAGIAASSDADSRLLLVYGAPVRTGGINGADLAVKLPGLERWQMRLLRDRRVRYVLMDRRTISDDVLAGYFFTTAESPEPWKRLVSREVYSKFDRPAVSRLYDSGDVTVYDVERLVRRRTAK